MKKLSVTISCCFCDNSHEAVVTLPRGWTTRYNGIDDASGFCPKHNKISEFAEAQCPGCVGGWGDCSLWSDFAYYKKNLTDEDFKMIRSGICPRRTNGTFSFGKEGLENINLSEQAENEAGIALEQAIKDYWEKYSRR